VQLTLRYVAEKKTRKRNKALDGLASLRAAGATTATFHQDGSVASVTFAAAEPRSFPLAAEPPPIIQEILTAPRPKSDLDVLSELPSYEDSN
jgi:hypothetical protein